MDITITPRQLNGVVHAIPSKSQAHRLLICAAFADQPSILECPETNKDITATVNCLNALGATITRQNDGYSIAPIKEVPDIAVLNCGESGSTLRFLLPIVGALGVDATFQMEGRLPQRPITDLKLEMERMGCKFSTPSPTELRCMGHLQYGDYQIAGNVSSQYITGLLFAMALLSGESSLTISGNLESKPYVQMTQDALAMFGVDTSNYHVTGKRPFRSPGDISVEGDWSNGAFFLVAQALGNPVTVINLNTNSSQGDKAIVKLLQTLERNCTISVTDIPDLVPALSVIAAANHGATFTDIQRLRLKESDRVASVIEMLSALGIQAFADNTTLTIYPGQFRGGVIDSHNDHRIAMSAAIAATVADNPVTILNASCVSKSYPSFWEEYRKLGGHYEQYIR